MLPDKFTFLDLETTGISPTHDRVIEIGILKVEKATVKEEYQTFVDPGVYLPPEITRLTGINSTQLELAPTFRAIKDKIDELTNDSLVVAHNAQFDVSFLKAEYGRLGDSFRAKSLCTAKLSRLLFPRFRRHNLDSIIDRFGLVCEERHRAFSDAKVLWDFYKIALETHGEEKLLQVVKKLLKKKSLPKGINSKLVDKLPKSPGVYTFFGSTGTPLYVGKSVNIKARVMSHFNSTHKSASELSIWEQITHIEYEETEGELSALLNERDTISKIKPIYNRQLRKHEEMFVLEKKKNSKGYFTADLSKKTEIDPDNLANILGIFKNIKRAKDTISMICDEYELCKKLMGLEKGLPAGRQGKGACFGYQIEKCAGACIGEEPSLSYNIRFTEAFTDLKIKKWPFPGSILLKEGSKAHLIKNWCYLGLVDEESFELQDVSKKQASFDYETYKILKKLLFNPKFAKNIVTL